MEFFNEMLGLLNDGKFEEIIEKISDFLQENPQYKTIDYYHFANPIEEVLYDVYFGDYDSIKRLDFDNQLDEIYLIYGISYMALNDMVNAEKYFKIANKINPVSAPALMHLCEFYQSVGKEEKLEALSRDIMKYTYEKNLLISSYFKLADFHYHTGTDMELYNHLFNFFVGIQSEEETDLSEDIRFLEKKNIQVGFNPEIIQILMYLIEVFTKGEMKSSVEYFKNILDEIADFNGYIEALKL